MRESWTLIVRSALKRTNACPCLDRNVKNEVRPSFLDIADINVIYSCSVYRQLHWGHVRLALIIKIYVQRSQ
jgi:hypothetical protein